jgi:hypothetical protein
MPPVQKKRTKAELEAAMAALQGEIDGAEPDEEVWVMGDDGVQVKLTGQRASSVLAKFSHLFDGTGDTGDTGDGGEGGEGGEGAPQTPGDSIFRRGGKKAA